MHLLVRPGTVNLSFDFITLITYHNSHVALYMSVILILEFAIFYILYTATDLKLEALFLCSFIHLLFSLLLISFIQSPLCISPN